VLICAADVRGTTVIRVSVEDITALASDVVVGTCSRVESRWTRDGGSILTYVTLANAAPLKGSAGGEVTFTTLGGRAGDVVMHVAGAPRFEKGEVVVVFLRRTAGVGPAAGDTDLTLIGLGQGKWRIAPDPSTGASTATSSTYDARVVEPPGRRIATRMSAAALIARIGAAVARQEQ
jgi:hypothetical protein